MIFVFIHAAAHAKPSPMKHLPYALMLATSLSLAACGTIEGGQFFDPDTTFSKLPQPEVKGVNDTQEAMAKEAAANGDFKRAGQFYAQLVGSQKGTPEQILRYKIGLADANRRLGNNEAALAQFEELYQQNAGNLDIAEGRGLSLMASGKISDAGRAFSEVLEKDPKRWRTLNAVGILFVTKNMVPEAIAYYTEALASSPDNPAVLNNVGLSYAIDRQFERGIQALDQASRLAKSPAQRKQIDLNLAMVTGVSGDIETAREIASKYLEGPALDNNLGLYAHLAKDDALAKSYLNMALSQSPVYYERAWENLDTINDAGRSDSPDAKPAPVNAKLPKLDALKAPEAAAVPTPSGKKKSSRRSSRELEKPSVTPQEKSDAGPVVMPEISVEKEAATPATPAEQKPTDTKPAETKPAVSTEKPAGLIVAPGE
jgi:Flp pilus assembly protein TadD